jgi:hypothetical protein
VNNPFGSSWALSLAGGCCLLMGCYLPPSSDEQFEDSIVITSRDGSADFATFQTFFVRPGVRVLDEQALEGVAGGGELVPEAVPDELASPLIEETRQQLLSRGYRDAAVADEAELAVELVYARNISSDYYCYYWSDWAYWGYPGYNYYYPYSCDTVTWRSGMLITNVVDLTLVAPARAAKANQTTAPSRDTFLRGIWFSGIYGAELESAAYVAARAVEGIDQAFAQSPYFSSSRRGQ